MNYIIILHFLAIIATLIIFYFLYIFIRSIKRNRRLEAFAVTKQNDNLTIEGKSLTFINKISNILKKIPLIKRLSKKYNKYIIFNSRFKSGTDYISLKLIFSLIFIIFYLFTSILTYTNISIPIIIFLIIIAILLPDFYCYYKYKSFLNDLNEELLRAIIILKNAYNAKESTNKALEIVINNLEGPIKQEFQKMLEDIKLGLGLREAFYRMYERTNLKPLLNISKELSLTFKTNVSNLEILSLAEDDYLRNNKLNNTIKIYRIYNIFISILLAIIPLILITTLIIYKYNTFIALFNKYDILLFIIGFILYIIYIIILTKYSKEVYHE